jgi:hypothetical protein
MKNRLACIGVASALAVAAALGIGGCGDNDNKGSNGAEQASVQESEAFIADLEEGVKIVNDQIQATPGMTQIMLASDVDKPTQKYSMLVMPYYPSEAVEKFIMTIQIEDGTDFYVTAVSAETGKTWQMDQDGTMTEVTEDD